MKKIITVSKWILGLFSLMLVGYFLGPKAHFEAFDNSPTSGKYEIVEVVERINERNTIPNLKEGNEEEIIWADFPRKTEYVVIYLHGFSASHEEGAPIHENIAKAFNANLYLSRLPRHGLNNIEAFEDLSPKMLVEYAKDAIKIGKSIGEKVILMSCSTGGTLSTYLAAADPEIDALVMFAPNFELYDKTSKLLTKPWGLPIARKIKGANYHTWPAPDRVKPYWNDKYRLEGLVALQSLLDQTMIEEIFTNIHQPIYVGYFYQDEEVRDFTISTDKIKEVQALIQTPADQQRFSAFPDGSAHVLVSPLHNDDWQMVETDVRSFLFKVFDYKAHMKEEESRGKEKQ